VLAAISLGSVLVAVAFRLLHGDGDRRLRIVLGSAAAALALLGWTWYRTGPGAAGWAARAGTPAALLKTRASTASTRATYAMLPKSFSATLAGRVTETNGAGGVVDVHLDCRVQGRLEGRLRVDLQGYPLDDGGVSMTASGVAFAAAGTQVYQGRIVGLNGNQVSARLADPSGHTLDLTLVVAVDTSSGAMSGTVDGSLA
jgi:hypothetical protein